MIGELRIKSTIKKKKTPIPWATQSQAIQFVNQESIAINKVFSFLHNASRLYPIVYYAQSTIAAALDISERHVRRAIDKLRLFGIIRTIQRFNQSLIYKVNPYYDWKFISIVLLMAQPNVLDGQMDKNVRLYKILREKDINPGINRFNGSESTNRKREYMDRVLVRKVMQRFELSKSQIDELEQFTDSHIQYGLDELEKRPDVLRPAAYFFATVRNAIRNGVRVGEKHTGTIQKPFVSTKPTTQPAAVKKIDKQAVEDRWAADNKRQRERKLARFNSYPPDRQQALRADYTKDPDWPISWGDPNLLFKDQPKPFSHKNEQGSRIAQLKAELDETLATLTKVAANKNVMIANGQSQLANTLCNPVMAMAQNRVLMLEAQIKELVKEEELWNHLEPVK